ncbi:mammalian cell entry domain-containing protein [Catenovulum agarivorans DS-2]|uniref:Mammalian cell entry domain-containing protein n=1 Tax=Catenovulum agarivorans DS-2 TaxID=1328313 RepID=W7QLA0_9ALTE|nr:intermembrane transport protein PqiB [Catenovulum agarivorans]EWH09697.1 mammalian cell entry domain-containing protein [Catenovulum agarivorans DS-2]
MQAPLVTKTTKLSSVWLIPFLALSISLWFVTQHYMNRGTEIQIRFASAEGVEAGKTQIKTLNVDVGVVTQVEINRDLTTVNVTARIKPQAENLLRQDSKFWVVKPRIGSKGVSGLTTILSGAYIELEPGKDYPGKTDFIGLDNPPLTRTNKQGLNLYLISDSVKALNAGDPVVHKGFEVGQITQIEVLNSNRIKTNIFIESPYDQMVTSNSRFYNSSGISFAVNAQGIEVFSDAIESTLTGGIAFDLPKGVAPGEAINDGAEFQLYPNQLAMEKHPFKHSVEFLLLFNRSIRGLNLGEFVEYRGVPVGTVVDIGFSYLAKNRFEQADKPHVPVLIRIDPARLMGHDTPQAQQDMLTALDKHINNGLKAALKTGSLVTGQSYIQLDFYPNIEVEHSALAQISGYRTIPTTHDDLDSMLSDIGVFANKLANIPVGKTFEQIDSTLLGAQQLIAQAEATLAQFQQLSQSADGYMQNPEMQALPQRISNLLNQLTTLVDRIAKSDGTMAGVEQTIYKLNQTLDSVKQVADTLESKPDSLLFSQPKQSDPIPGASNQ